MENVLEEKREKLNLNHLQRLNIQEIMDAEPRVTFCVYKASQKRVTADIMGHFFWDTLNLSNFKISKNVKQYVKIYVDF